MNIPITIVLADDHALVRRSLAAILRTATGLSIVGDAGTTDEAISLAIRHQPTVVVLDIDIPGVECFEAARTIRSRCARTSILFLSAFSHDRYIDAALNVGALGYVTKSEPPEAVIAAIRAIASGQCYFSPDIQSRIVISKEGVRLANEPKSRSATLTAREVEVLRYIARGMSKKEIAQTMHLSVKTVENHASNVMTRLAIHDRVELARYAIREGLVEA